MTNDRPPETPRCGEPRDRAIKLPNNGPQSEEKSRQFVSPSWRKAFCIFLRMGQIVIPRNGNYKMSFFLGCWFFFLSWTCRPYLGTWTKTNINKYACRPLDSRREDTGGCIPSKRKIPCRINGTLLLSNKLISYSLSVKKKERTGDLTLHFGSIPSHKII